MQAPDLGLRRWRVTLEWPYSSPMRIMGTPCDRSSAAARLRIWRCRRRSTFCLDVSPSAPQFQLRLWFSPSLRRVQDFGSAISKCLGCSTVRVPQLQSATPDVNMQHRVTSATRDMNASASVQQQSGATFIVHSYAGCRSCLKFIHGTAHLWGKENANFVVPCPPVALAVGLVVLLVVSHEVAQGEAVVRRDEVDAVLRAPPSSPLPAAVVAPPVTCAQSTPRASATLLGRQHLTYREGCNLASVRAVTAVTGRLSSMLCSPHAGASKSGALPFQVNTTAIEKDKQLYRSPSGCSEA